MAAGKGVWHAQIRFLGGFLVEMVLYTCRWFLPLYGGSGDLRIETGWLSVPGYGGWLLWLSLVGGMCVYLRGSLPSPDLCDSRTVNYFIERVYYSETLLTVH